ncbi:hypothetical protein ACFSJQ_18565 [Vibrio olivae]|uniref:Uncharacterized protein n=1 Tax=Vibrio olivae TaxID=1243002 RepID=A0ABV5HN70_9VIBR
MNNTITDIAYKRAILATLSSLTALAFDSADIVSIRIEYSSSLHLVNMIVFSQFTTHRINHAVMLEADKALEDLLKIEDDLIDLIAQYRDQTEEA